MKTAVTTIVVWALLGCSGMPPKPPKCVGEFRPINQSVQLGATGEQSVANLCTGGTHGNQG